jgi:hypothetical protein
MFPDLTIFPDLELLKEQASLDLHKFIHTQVEVTAISGPYLIFLPLANKF